MVASYPVPLFSTIAGAQPVGGVDLNKLVDGVNDLNLRVAARAGCRLRRVANQSVATASTVDVSWDTEDEDVGGFITVTSSTVTIPTGYDGTYGITYRAAGLVTNRFVAMIAVTSAITGYPSDFRMPSNDVEDAATITLSGIPLLGGDSFKAQVFHTTGANVNFTAWLSCYRIGN